MDAGAYEFFQAQAHLYKYLFSFVSSMSLKGAIQLGIPDIIHSHGQPITLSELMSALPIHPTKVNCLYRLMRMLVHLGFFATTRKYQGDEDEEAYVLTPASKVLLKDQPNCLSPFVLGIFDPALVTTWQFLGDWMKGEKLTAFESVHGMGFWNYMDQNPESNNLFHEGMASDSQMMNLVVRECKPIFEHLNSIVDVGGGTGSIAKIISEAYPHLKCTVLELPHVVGSLSESSHQNLKFIAGDMFEHIPSADAVLLKLVLHDFGDEDCIKVLKRCREAIKGKEGAKVIIIDIVINEKKDEHEITEAKLYFDMLMMTLLSGRQRNANEWERLFMEAGFSHYKIRPIFGLRSLIEVYP